MEKHLYICDECQKHVDKIERYPLPVNAPSGWITFNGLLEYEYLHKILSGKFDFCSVDCFIKHVGKNLYKGRDNG